MKSTLLLFVLLVLVSCKEGKPQETYYTSNKDYQVSKLFEHEGCSVYRFEDERKHYYVRCKDRKDSVISTFSETCGKDCVRYLDDEVTTEYK